MTNVAIVVPQLRFVGFCYIIHVLWSVFDAKVENEIIFKVCDNFKIASNIAIVVPQLRFFRFYRIIYVLWLKIYVKVENKVIF